MKETKENILNGLMNIVLIGLPIALVLIFGEKFSLWINLLTIGCVLFVTSVLSGIIGDEYETPKRILHALIGASIAVCLNTVAYPGHTTIIIMSTILIICTADLINRGIIICLEFHNRARLRFLGKFILLITTLFTISMVITNFGSQKIWLPIVSLSLMISLVFFSGDYLRSHNINKGLVAVVLIALLLSTGIISTIIQFQAVELFWGLDLLELMIIITTLAIVTVISIINYRRKSRKAAVLALRQKNEAEEQRRKEEAKKEKEAREEKEQRARELVQSQLAKIETSSSIDAMQLSILYENNKDLGVNIIFEKDINVKSIWENLTVSNHKNQMVWNTYFHNALLMFLYAAEKQFEDQYLERLLLIVTAIRNNILERKGKNVEYEGEKILEEKLQKIENAAKR